MKQPDPILHEQYLLDRLREILLKEDRERIEALEEVINDLEKLSPKVNPIIIQHLNTMRDEFPMEYQKIVDEMIDWKLKGAQEKILDLIYPVIGKMIRKYVKLQFQQFRENLEQQLQRRLRQGIVGRIRYALFGLGRSEKDAMLVQASGPVVEEIYVIEQYSGILMGSASRQETIDLDMIAGMLTAIKSFVEDAFKRVNEDLEMIQYGSYSILIQNFYTFFIATAISGTITHQEEEELRKRISDFAQARLLPRLEGVNKANNRQIRDMLEERFFEKTYVAKNPKVRKG